VEDPEWILAEIKSLVEAHFYNFAQIEEIYPNLLTRLEDLLKLDLTEEVRAETLFVITEVESRMSQFNEDKLQETLRLYRKTSNHQGVVSILNTLAAMYCKQGQWDNLLIVTTETLKLADESGNLRGYGRALLYFALYERFQGRLDLARGHYERASQLLEEAGDIYFLAVVLNNLADLEIARGHLSKGLYLLQKALFLWKIVRHREKIVVILTQIGRVHVLKGNIPEARRFFGTAGTLTPPDQPRDPLELVYELSIQAELEKSQGNLDKALHLAKKAISILEELKNTGIYLAYAWGLMANIFLEMRNLSEAEGALETSETVCASLDYSEGIINNIRLRGILELQKDNLGLAQEFFEAAGKKAEENGYSEMQIQIYLSLADLNLRRLKINFNKVLRKNAKKYLLRASRLAERTALESGKLEAKILEAVAHSLDLAFEEAVEILGEVVTTASSLRLHLVEKKARTVRAQIHKISPETELSDDEMLGYLTRAQKYISEAQATFKDT
jgi:tetratricopeptide (TPR) repeat protein